MLDPKILRKDTAKVIQNLKRRGYVFDELLWNELEEKRKKLQGFTEEQQAELNDLSKAIGIGKKNCCQDFTISTERLRRSAIPSMQRQLNIDDKKKREILLAR